ncbi:hypothetical protein CEXT_190001 [Caerostris extrusa]|uniref:Uncharacterized protein n=1 Tax=Caerostris extrusa TaxID=172846 RepID=A0AAV4MX54_CAEEX|nr:hypothetical protein CEXT_190001 [Caerostris extrusa]
MSEYHKNCASPAPCLEVTSSHKWPEGGVRKILQSLLATCLSVPVLRAQELRADDENAVRLRLQPSIRSEAVQPELSEDAQRKGLEGGAGCLRGVPQVQRGQSARPPHHPALRQTQVGGY